MRNVLKGTLTDLLQLLVQTRYKALEGSLWAVN